MIIQFIQIHRPVDSYTARKVFQSNWQIATLIMYAKWRVPWLLRWFTISIEIIVWYNFSIFLQALDWKRWHQPWWLFFQHVLHSQWLLLGLIYFAHFVCRHFLFILSVWLRRSKCFSLRRDEENFIRRWHVFCFTFVRKMKGNSRLLWCCFFSLPHNFVEYFD